MRWWSVRVLGEIRLYRWYSVQLELLVRTRTVMYYVWRDDNLLPTHLFETTVDRKQAQLLVETRTTTRTTHRG